MVWNGNRLWNRELVLVPSVIPLALHLRNLFLLLLDRKLRYNESPNIIRDLKVFRPFYYSKIATLICTCVICAIELLLIYGINNFDNLLSLTALSGLANWRPKLPLFLLLSAFPNPCSFWDFPQKGLRHLVRISSWCYLILFPSSSVLLSVTGSPSPGFQAEKTLSCNLQSFKKKKCLGLKQGSSEKEGRYKMPCWKLFNDLGV